MTNSINKFLKNTASDGLLVFLVLSYIIGCHQQSTSSFELSPSGENKRIVSSALLHGDWQISATISYEKLDQEVNLFYAANDDLSKRVYWNLTPDTLKLYRITDGNIKLLKIEKFVPGKSPWKISMLKRGTYYLLNINDRYAATVVHPSGDIDYMAGGGVAKDEPVTAKVGFEATRVKLKIENLQTDHGTWTPELPQHPVLNYGTTSWTEGQIFPGAILEVNNQQAYRDNGGYYYMYVNGSDVNAYKQESGGIIRIGVARSPDLINWELANKGEFLLEGTPGEWDETSIMVNGAIIQPDGKIVLSYMGWSKTIGKWSGVGLAFAEKPEGPFKKQGKPVLPIGSNSEWDGTHIHEHYLTKFNDQYVCFYTGHNFAVYHGDQIGIAVSNDLIQWTKDVKNPVMSPTKNDNEPGVKMWDNNHIRGRDVKKVGEYYYLLYEGAMGETDRIDMPTHFWDSIGLARSRSLTGPWERHPLNPIIQQQPGNMFDSIWTGWPRTVINDDQVYIYYAAGDNRFAENPHRASTGLRIVPLERYMSWNDLFNINSRNLITFELSE